MNIENIPQSESGLLVFISSRQSEEMTAPRRDAFRAIEEFPLTHPWAFEDMPASSEAAREHYMRYVSQANFVIWLVGRETTPAVADEIHACVAVQGRLLAFLLPSDVRDEQTNKLIDEVSQYAKWSMVEFPDSLGAHIKAALHDEIVRALRSSEPPGRLSWLNGQREETTYRSKRSWTSLGVPEDIAE